MKEVVPGMMMGFCGSGCMDSMGGQQLFFGTFQASHTGFVASRAESGWHGFNF
jgi:hypothetical protein